MEGAETNTNGTSRIARTMSDTETPRDRLIRHPHTKGDGSWWERDARGIELCRVCDECKEAKLSCYRPEILTGYNQNDVNEPIEADE